LDFVDWQSKDYPWHELKFVVVGPVWNYAEHIDEFYEFLGMLKRHGIQTFNSLEVIEWNLNKKYLLELQKILCIPFTIIIDKDFPDAFENAWN